MRRELMGEFDAKIWAKEFIKVIKNNPDIIIDEDLMLGWFANAIMAGYDRGKMSEKVDVNILDDIEFVYGKEATQKGTKLFYHKELKTIIATRKKYKGLTEDSFEEKPLPKR